MFNLSRKNTNTSALLCVLILTIALVMQTNAYPNKLRQIDNRLSMKRTNSVSALEQRISRFLQTKNTQAQTVSGRLNSSDNLNQADLFYLTKVWDKLDKKILKGYVDASKIPDTFKQYVSPGKHFEVYYNTDPIQSKLQNDNYGYDTLINWLQNTTTPNGTPDYVDEIAWALDSSWSMEVDRFGFQPPIPLVENTHNSLRYKVVAFSFGDSDYGSTYPIGKSDSRQGWVSSIQINTDFESLGYGLNPEDAIRVTCAHEFFHAIQFAMIWNVVTLGTLQLDDYPISWLEGTATSMEEIGFPSINDYVQYAGGYFDEPETPFFNDNMPSGKLDNFIYSNSLLGIYLYNYVRNSPDIYFFHTMMYNNFLKRTPFDQNLRQTSTSLGTTWTALLNKFHTSSFFSGLNSDTSVFLSDAHHFDSLFYQQDTAISSAPLQKSIPPYAMNIFTYQSPLIQSDTLFLHLRHISDNNISLDMPWAAAAILRKNGKNTIIPISLNNKGDGALTVKNWTVSDQILVLVTNGDPSQTKDYSVAFDNCAITHNENEKFTINVTADDLLSSASIAISSKVALRCDLTLATTEQRPLIDNAILAGLQPISSIFSLKIPFVWESGTDRIFSISVPNQSDSTNIGVYYWNSIVSKWQKIDTTVMRYSKDTLVNDIENVLSGEYAIFKSGVPTTISMYPNPVSLRKKSISFEGAIINDIYIFDVNGALVYRTNKKSENLITKWNLTNSSNKTVSPGYYLAVVNFDNSSTNTVKTVHKKLMVVP